MRVVVFVLAATQHSEMFIEHFVVFIVMDANSNRLMMMITMMMAVKSNTSTFLVWCFFGYYSRHTSQFNEYTENILRLLCPWPLRYMLLLLYARQIQPINFQHCAQCTALHHFRVFSLYAVRREWKRALRQHSTSFQPASQSWKNYCSHISVAPVSLFAMQMRCMGMFTLNWRWQ